MSNNNIYKNNSANFNFLNFSALCSISFSAFVLLALDASAQLVYNNGAVASIQTGCVVIVKTNSVRNAVGEIRNAGSVTIEGDMTNDATTTGGGSNGVFNIQGNWVNNGTFTSDQSLVNLNGGNQQVTGSVSSSFYDLVLNGSGIKTLGINASVTNTLNLNSFELATNSFKLFVTNPATNAIVFTSGFVSSLGNGRLSRATNNNASYLFPVGSSAGTLRYRPVTINPTTTTPQTFAVRLANVDPSSENYNRTQAEAAICQINPAFYHLVERTIGSSPADLTLTYDPATDGNWQNNAHWQIVPQWQQMAGSVTGVSGTLNTVTNAAWNDFTQPAFGFAEIIPTVSISGLAPNYCANSAPVQLTGSPTGGIFSGTGISGNTFSPTTAGLGTYTITYTVVNSGSNCQATSTQQVSVTTNPVTTVTPLGPTSFCPGESVILDAGPGYTSYLWTPGGATTQTITVNTAGNYSVTVSSSAGCTGTASSNPITVTVFPGISPTITASGDTLISTIAAAYQWYLNGIAISNATSQHYLATLSGNYQVSVTSANGCHKMSSVVEFSPRGTGIEDDFNTQSLSLFPNPGGGIFTIEGTFRRNVDLQLNITNMLGQQLMKPIVIKNTINLTRTISVDEFANGVYFIKVLINNEAGKVFRYVKN